MKDEKVLTWFEIRADFLKVVSVLPAFPIFSPLTRIIFFNCWSPYAK